MGYENLPATSQHYQYFNREIFFYRYFSFEMSSNINLTAGRFPTPKILEYHQLEPVDISLCSFIDVPESGIDD